jgi:hypothetical protein
MSIEAYYCRVKGKPPITLNQLAARMAEAGLPCEIAPDAEDAYWLTPSVCESGLLVSVKNDEVILATLHYVLKDDVSVMNRIERVFESVGMSADEEAEYA